MSDILTVTQEILELLNKHELTRVQSMFALKATEMQVQEAITREVIEDSKKGYDNTAGIH